MRVLVALNSEQAESRSLVGMPADSSTQQVFVVAKKAPVASYTHTLGLLGLFAGYFMVAFILNSSTQEPGASVQPTARPNLLPGYFESIAFDWAILWYVWRGLRDRGIGLLQLSGGRWASPRHVLSSLLLAVPFWILWEAVAITVSRLLATTGSAGSDRWVVPEGAIEVSIWIALSLTAGFCEELIFRGYLQHQFSAFFRNNIIGIFCQGIIFGLVHPRGWQAVLTISVLGWLYGVWATWRRDLKSNIFAHAMSDIWEGWLKHLLALPF